VLLRLRKPMDPLGLHDWLSRDWEVLAGAVSRVRLLGDEALVKLSTDVLLKCANLIELAAAIKQDGGPLRGVRHAYWPKETQERWQSGVAELGDLRLYRSRFPGHRSHAKDTECGDELARVGPDHAANSVVSLRRATAGVQ